MAESSLNFHSYKMCRAGKLEGKSCLHSCLLSCMSPEQQWKHTWLGGAEGMNPVCRLEIQCQVQSVRALYLQTQYSGSPQSVSQETIPVIFVPILCRKSHCFMLIWRIKGLAPLSLLAPSLESQGT